MKFCTRNSRPNDTIKPRASKTSRFGELAASRRKHSQCTARPSIINSANDAGSIHSGETPNAVCIIHVK